MKRPPNWPERPGWSATLTLLDRFRAQSRHRHPDPSVRLSHVEEIPLENREMIGTIAREDEDPRVRRAAVSKLMDSTALAGVARDDKDETVRAAASSMLRDIALEAFEGLTEADSMDAVDAMADARALTQIARTATRDVIALRALSRVQETHSLGSIARHAASEAARLGALDGLRERSDRAEILAVALNGEHQDAAIAAVDLVTDRQELEQIAARAKSKGACRRARLALRAAETSSPPAIDVEPLTIGAREVPFVASRDVPTNGRGELHADGIHLPQGGFDAEAGRGRGEEPVRLDGVEAVEPARPEAVPEAPGRENERKGARLAELAEIMARAAAAADLEAARKVLALTRAEWADLGGGAAVDPQVSSCYAEAEADRANRGSRRRRRALPPRDADQAAAFARQGRDAV
jgi:hypothetical protein